ncbi:hypothetical protein DCE79_06325 [Lysinibacillus sp. 2017]|uniref:recombinase family protein n=1 Tax=unclassified Lysinibacillus TaxID=2636778 RepID=UPI000D5261D1|nr:MULTISPECIES: recombinase family protein [unclassified Lysinibacillus]AWE07042.1 hypothetical protein DCE79_06325 [Lysinibacillus sp. 2017]TGN37036.1 recombinase family protein [Lysinibacillus sp. S2017]
MITLEKMLDLSSYELEKEVYYVFAYARKSQPKRETEDEENRIEKDLEMQVARLEDYCKRKGWKFKLFREVKSGENISDRPVMQEMLKEIQEGFCDAVIVVDYDRLSRGSGRDQERILNVLRNSATLIVEVSGVIFNPLNREDMNRLKMKGLFSNFEYGQIVSRFTSYKRIGAKEGKWVSGKTPFGYDRDRKTKHLIINKEEGEIYKERILKPFLNGKIVDQIVQELNNAKIPSPRNKEWTTPTVIKLLKSELYCGTIIYNKTTGSKKSMDSINKDPYRKLPPEKWTYAYDAHPPLKTLEEQDIILGLFKTRGKIQSKTNLHPLHALVKCYNCGHSMHIQKCKQKKDQEKEKFRFKPCKCGKNKGGTIEIIDTVINGVFKIYEEKLLATNIKQDEVLKQSMYAKDVEKIKNEIALNEKAIERIENAFEMGEYTIEKMIRSRKKREGIIVKLIKDIEQIHSKQSKITVIDKDKMLKRLRQYKKRILQYHNNPEKLREVYINIFDKIIWKKMKDDEAEITVKFLLEDRS